MIGKVIILIHVTDTLVVGLIKVEIHSPVAQLVERLTVNQNVRGSSPRRGAKFLNKNNNLQSPAICGALFIWKRATFTPKNMQFLDSVRLHRNWLAGDGPRAAGKGSFPLAKLGY